MDYNVKSACYLLFILAVTFIMVADGFDCYYCANCFINQRGVRLAAPPGDWCYKIVWQSSRGSAQFVSRGSSSDCRQDIYNDPSMSIPGLFSGTARYCCRGHLCNSVPTRIQPCLLFMTMTVVSLFIFF